MVAAIFGLGDVQDGVGGEAIPDFDGTRVLGALVTSYSPFESRLRRAVRLSTRRSGPRRRQRAGGHGRDAGV